MDSSLKRVYYNTGLNTSGVNDHLEDVCVVNIYPWSWDTAVLLGRHLSDDDNHNNIQFIYSAFDVSVGKSSQSNCSI